MFLILFFFELYIIDQPDIEGFEHGVYTIQLRFGPEGEILGFGNLNLWDRLGLGISYGASNLIGAGDPEFYKQPGVQLRLLAIEQGLITPPVILGFNNQGYGRFKDHRYEIMSKGIYLQVGQIFDYPGLEITPSLGINYSFEEGGRFDIFCGIEFLFGSTTQFLAEYSPNFNDRLDQNKGYLNIALRLIFYEQLFFEFALRDLLDNSRESQQLNRMIKIGYQEAL